MGGPRLIILDTHAWIWFNLSPQRLASDLLATIEGGDEEIGLSAVSIWETILAVQRGRIRVDLGAQETVRAWLAANLLTVLPIDEEVAILARTLEFEHEDPADRFIAATAYKHGCALVTADARLRRLPWLKAIPPK